MPDPISCWTKREKGSLVVLCDKNTPWYLYSGVGHRHDRKSGAAWSIQAALLHRMYAMLAKKKKKEEEGEKKQLLLLL